MLAIDPRKGILGEVKALEIPLAVLQHVPDFALGEGPAHPLFLPGTLTLNHPPDVAYHAGVAHGSIALRQSIPFVSLGLCDPVSAFACDR